VCVVSQRREWILVRKDLFILNAFPLQYKKGSVISTPTLKIVLVKD
jgi:hypothetical protein